MSKGIQTFTRNFSKHSAIDGRFPLVIKCHRNSSRNHNRNFMIYGEDRTCRIHATQHNLCWYFNVTIKQKDLMDTDKKSGKVKAVRRVYWRFCFKRFQFGKRLKSKYSQKIFYFYFTYVSQNSREKYVCGSLTTRTGGKKEMTYQQIYTKLLD